MTDDFANPAFADTNDATATASVAAANQAPTFSAPLYTVQRVSTASDGSAQSGGFGLGFEAPALSADGTKVLFSSTANNLVAGDTNNVADIFMKDLTTGITTRVSTTASGGQVTGASSTASFSADGTKIIFSSSANDLVAGDTNPNQDVFVKTLATGAVERVSRSSDGITITNFAADGTFSADGTKVAFQTQNGVYVRDLTTGVMTLVSTSASGVAGNGNAYGQPRFSPDGTKILFSSPSNNLVAGDTNGQSDVFIKDLQTGAVTLVSVATGGAQGNAYSGFADWSPDGTKVVFASNASNLVAGDTNGARDIFVRDLVAGTSTLVSAAADGTLANGGSQGSSGSHPFFSADGTTIYFDSDASNLVPADTNGSTDIFAKNIVTGAITRIDLTESLGQGTGGRSLDPAGSASGLITFRTSQQLASGDADGNFDAYVVSPGTNGVPKFVEGNGPVAVVTAANVADDGANFNHGTFGAAITANAVAGDQLYVANAGGITLIGSSVQYNAFEIGVLTASATGVSIALESTATSAAVKALTEAIRYNSTSDDPTSATRTVTFTLMDGGGTANGGHDTTSFTRGISVTPVDDAPVVDLNGAATAGIDTTAAYTENGAKLRPLTGITLSDVDNTTLTGATVTIGADFHNGDILRINGTTSGAADGITYNYDAGTGVLRLTGTASVATYQSTLATLMFLSTSDAPGASRDIAVVVNDGTMSSTAAHVAVTITEVNDAPVNTLPAARTGVENGALTFSNATGNAMSVFDPDAGSADIRVKLHADYGSITLAGTQGVAVTGDGTHSLVLLGSTAAINAALDGMRYQGDPDYIGRDTLTITTNDLGNSGVGGSLIAKDSVAITLVSQSSVAALTDMSAGSNHDSVAPVVGIHDPVANTLVLPGIDTVADSGHTLVLSDLAPSDAAGAPSMGSLHATKAEFVHGLLNDAGIDHWLPVDHLNAGHDFLF